MKVSNNKAMVFLILLLAGFSYSQEPAMSVAFTDIHSDNILNLEKEIVYLYGVSEPEKVMTHYLEAIKALESHGVTGDLELLKQCMLPYLKEAYAEVRRQTAYQFNIEKAALLEFDLILAQTVSAPFEEIQDIMLSLYGEVFQADDSSIQKAAMLRTFLYKYKIFVLSKLKDISPDDIRILIDIAKTSERELNSHRICNATPE